MTAPSAGQPAYLELEAKSLTRSTGWTDPWFLARYGMNLYRGCEHGCAYCDGRAERYVVEGVFDLEVRVKANALVLLERELASVPEPGFLMVGGGVGDAYQGVEQRTKLARGVLEFALRKSLPVHVLTKSAGVARDFDLLERLAKGPGAILSFSISLAREPEREALEPGASPLSERWQTLADARRLGIHTGVCAMPLLPCISDDSESISSLFREARRVEADFVCAAGLTLRPGRQMEHYLAVLARFAPHAVESTRAIFQAAPASGSACASYYRELETRLRPIREASRMPGRPPRHLFAGRVPLYTEVAVLLEHEASVLRASGDAATAMFRAGSRIHKWAAARLTNARRARAGFEQVEQEFREVLRDGTLDLWFGLRLADMAREMAASSPRYGAPQRSLFG